MVGYKCFNLNIIAKNHEDLQNNYNAITDNILKIAETAKGLSTTNYAYIRSDANENVFMIIHNIVDKPYIQLFQYNLSSHKLFDAVLLDDIVSILGDEFYLSRILKSIKTGFQNNMIHEHVTDLISNYIDSHPQMNAEDYKNCNLDDFEIDDYGDIGD